MSSVSLISSAIYQDGPEGRRIISDLPKLMDYLYGLRRIDDTEILRVLFFDPANGLLADEIMACGSVSGVDLSPRSIMIRALELGAAGIILVHNHPSGDPRPSRADLDATRRLAHAGATLDIPVRDHIILGGGRWSSFRLMGLI